MVLLVPVSNGEVIDKYTILLIKKIFIENKEKIDKVNKEIEFLKDLISDLLNKYKIEDEFNNLYEVNKKLWNIEDDIRIKEKNKIFDSKFIELARSVYITNDERSEIKNEINLKTESNIFEVKSYKKYK